VYDERLVPFGMRRKEARASEYCVSMCRSCWCQNLPQKSRTVVVWRSVPKGDGQSYTITVRQGLYKDRHIFQVPPAY
jgi:hypothetical protein